jgi:glycosyltransferase involved in cell wall biosynthesis
MNDKIKIFVDCHVFDHGYQGTRTYIEGLYREMIKLNPNMEFYFAACDVKNLKQCFGTPENVVYLKYRTKSKFLRLLFDAPRLISQSKIDYAHFQYIVPPFKRCKYIVTIHDVLFIDFKEYFSFKNRLINTILYYISSKVSDIVLTVSNYSKERIQTHFNIHKIAVTPNAVSEEFFLDLDKEEIKKELLKKYKLDKYIIYVSRWELRKNQELLLNSFIHLKLYQDYKLVFIGDVSTRNVNFDTIYNKLPNQIKEKICFLKKTSHSDLVKLVQGAKVSVYPSKAEGFGIPVLESVAAKVPTLISNKTAMSDFDFLSEYSFDPYNQKEFDELLIKTINSYEKIDLTALMETCRKRYSWKFAAKILSNKITDF